jgi:hypothetical protein
MFFVIRFQFVQNKLHKIFKKMHKSFKVQRFETCDREGFVAMKLLHLLIHIKNARCYSNLVGPFMPLSCIQLHKPCIKTTEHRDTRSFTEHRHSFSLFHLTKKMAKVSLNLVVQPDTSVEVKNPSSQGNHIVWGPTVFSQICQRFNSQVFQEEEPLPAIRNAGCPLITTLWDTDELFQPGNTG